MGFLERYEDALKVADEGWQFRAHRGSEAGDSAQFVAEAGDGPFVGTMVGFPDTSGSDAVWLGGVRDACLARSAPSRDRRTARCCRRLGAQPQCFPHAARGARGQCVGARVLSPARLCRDRAACAACWIRPRTSSSWRCRSTQPTEVRAAPTSFVTVRQLRVVTVPSKFCSSTASISAARSDAVRAPQVGGLPANRELLRIPGVVDELAQSASDHLHQ